MTGAAGTHILIDAWGSSPDLTDDAALIEAALLGAADAGGVSVLVCNVHKFSPLGATGFALLSESHIAVHTWPELNYFSADLFFCGGDIEAAKDALLEALKPERVEVRRVLRGEK